MGIVWKTKQINHWVCQNNISGSIGGTSPQDARAYIGSVIISDKCGICIYTNSHYARITCLDEQTARHPMVSRPGHTAQNSRKRMNHAQNLVVRACPSRIWPFLLTYGMKNHRWIAQELRKDHEQITNKPRTSAHRHEKAPNRANAWLCVTNTRRKSRIISALSLVNCVWIAHDSRMNCANNAQEALKLRSFRAYKTDAAAVPWHSRFNSRRQHIVSLSSSSSPFSSVSGPPKILTISEY